MVRGTARSFRRCFSLGDEGMVGTLLAENEIILNARVAREVSVEGGEITIGVEQNVIG